MKKGLIHIYTGDGKGKTTASVGLAVRALGHGLKVCYVYFHKNPEKYGYTEIKSLSRLGAETIGIAKGHPFCEKDSNAEDFCKEIELGLENIIEKNKTSKYDLLILDEIIISVRDGFLDEEKLLAFIDQKPEGLELIMTGRGVTKKMISKADYVSDITKLKHPFDKNITSREGIEY